MYKAQDKPANAANSLKFFDWAFANGDKMADDLEYVPLPAAVKDLVRKPWAANIKDAAGKAGYLAVSCSRLAGQRGRRCQQRCRSAAVHCRSRRRRSGADMNGRPPAAASHAALGRHCCSRCLRTARPG